MNRGRALAQLTELLAGRTPRAPDWRAVLALAGEQLLVPQLCERLSAVRDDVPAEVWSYLVESQRRSRARNARLHRTLGDALTALNAAGIEPVLLKGCAMWAGAPGAPPHSDRLVSDLDLLVRPQEMQQAVDSLADAGFLVLEDDRLTRAHDVVVLGRASDVGAIDLHQQAPGGAADLGNLHDHARTVTFERGAAKVLSPEFHVLVTVLHDQLHDAHFWRGGFDMRHLLDIAAIAEGPVDWARVAAMCRTPLTRAALAAHLHAARRIAGASIPEDMLAGVWGRFHFWRQKTQFAWPWINAVIDAVRNIRGAGQVQRWVWFWLLRRTAGGMRAG